MNEHRGCRACRQCLGMTRWMVLVHTTWFVVGWTLFSSREQGRHVDLGRMEGLPVCMSENLARMKLAERMDEQGTGDHEDAARYGFRP